MTHRNDPLGSPDRLRQMASQLRSDAYFAYVDGRTKRARELNGKADKLDGLARALENKAHA